VGSIVTGGNLREHDRQSADPSHRIFFTTPCE
jgi:hypothetical protein